MERTMLERERILHERIIRAKSIAEYERSLDALEAYRYAKQAFMNPYRTERSWDSPTS